MEEGGRRGSERERDYAEEGGRGGSERRGSYSLKTSDRVTEFDCCQALFALVAC